MLRYWSVCGMALLSWWVYQLLQGHPPPPDVPRDLYWGPGPHRHDSQEVLPFVIEFNDTMIEDLKGRIKNRRQFTPPLEGVQHEYGFNAVFLEEVLHFWADRYQFSARAARINHFIKEAGYNENVHFTTSVQGLNIHFVHVKPQPEPGVKVLPLLLLHGWPSSSYEFLKLIPLLVEKRPGYDFVFEVVAPDLPGFGFSEGTSKPGLNTIQMGLTMRRLMQRLGHQQFYVHAGDWGSQAASHLTILHPEDVLGFHNTMPISGRGLSLVKMLVGALYPPFVVPAQYAARLYPLSELFQYILREFGYYHIQATKPDTVGFGLTDSPAGLAAYILEKLSMCINRDALDQHDAGLLAAFSLDELLDVLTIVWTNSCITTSMRLYAESSDYRARPELRTIADMQSLVPTAVTNFKYEVLYQPEWMLRDKYPLLVRATTFDYGGHFPALEHPVVLAGDIYDSTVAFLAYHRHN